MLLHQQEKISFHLSFLTLDPDVMIIFFGNADTVIQKQLRKTSC